LQVGEKPSIRNVQTQLDEPLKITALNTTFEERVIPKSAAALLEIVGRVVWHGKNHG